MHDILVGMLTYKNGSLTKRAIESIGDKVDRLFVDNGAEDSVKRVLPEIETIHNPVNIGVNPGWNQIVRHFLAGDWKWLVLASSDVTMANNWADVLRSHYSTPKSIFVPALVNDIACLNTPKLDILEEATGGVAGFFYCLPREAVEMTFPIPEEIKIWFGDEWVFTRLRMRGWKLLILNAMAAHHVWSSNITHRCRGIIEEDKVAWETVRQRL